MRSRAAKGLLSSALLAAGLVLGALGIDAQEQAPPRTESATAATAGATSTDSEADSNTERKGKTQNDQKNDQTMPEETQNQTPDGFASDGSGSTALAAQFAKNVWSDQKAIWTSPLHLTWADGSWLFPMAAVTGGLLATDASAAKSISSNPVRTARYQSFSNYGLAGLGAAGAGLFLWSKLSHDDHKRETALLAGEAAVDSLGVSTALEYSLGRPTPNLDQGRGSFFQGGDSFPSDHAALAWSFASVLAHEYPGPLTDIAAYGAAAAISAARIEGRNHFPSDVFIGSALGWLIGRQVYRAHHDQELGGAAAGLLSFIEGGEEQRDRRDMGSPFVALDSWIYPALERLAGQGYVNTAILGIKPWTRLECARLVQEANERMGENSAVNSSAAALEARLEQEFASELSLLGGGRNLRAAVDSVYTRSVAIAGPALSSSYYFGQTLSDDFGRPFETGFNDQTGGSAWAAAGPLVFYVRAEYQHAPSAPAPSTAAVDLIAERDIVPVSEVPAGPVPAVNRLQFLDAYAAVNIHNWQLVLGRQSLSYGPTDDSMFWSDNVEPVEMVRLTNPEAIRLPGVLRFLGPVRTDDFFGRLEGRPYNPRPFIYGQKYNIKPFPFLEVGLGRTEIIGGTSVAPLTTTTFFDSLFGLRPPKGLGSGVYVGSGHSEVDMVFYVPKVRNYLVLYGEGYASDNPLPLSNPSRNPWHPGLYITRFPGLPKLDLHVESVSTEQPGRTGAGALSGGNQGEFNYWNDQYRDGYTQDGFLIGNAVGRDGQTVQAWLRYWISPTNTLQFTYRHNQVAADFIPGGGAWQDYAVHSELYFPSGMYIKSGLQIENISSYPFLFQGPRKNLAMTVEMGFSPRRASRPAGNAVANPASAEGQNR